MRKETVTRTLYTYDELSDSAKDEALAILYDINVDCEWWECTVSDINRFGELSSLGCLFGGEFDLDRSDYLSIDVPGCLFSELCTARQTGKAWDYFPKAVEKILDPFFKTFTAREIYWLCAMEKRDLIGSMSGKTYSRRYGKTCEVWLWDSRDTHKRTKALFEKLYDEWDALLSDLEHYFKKLLRQEYECLTSREAIEESIRCNEYEFLADGTLA